MIQDFIKIWETEYLVSRVKKVTEAVSDGNYEMALDILTMIKDKAEFAEAEINKAKKVDEV